MKLPIWRSAIASLGLLFWAALPAQGALINGGFEQSTPLVPSASFIIVNQSNVPGWSTTSTDSNIELWSSGFESISGGPVPAFEGNQFAEINATQFATLYQDVSGIAAGSIVGFQFAHRGRSGVDTMRLTITDLGGNNQLGGGDDTVLFTNDYSDGNTAWGFYTSAGLAPLTALGNNVRFAYQAITTAGGDPTIGNFIDSVDFGIGVGTPVPVPGTLLLLCLGLAGLGIARRRA